MLEAGSQSRISLILMFKRLQSYRCPSTTGLANTSLALGEVVKSETRVVAGTNNQLVIETKDGEAMANYVAVVWEEWECSRKLTSFTESQRSRVKKMQTRRNCFRNIMRKKKSRRYDV